MKKLLFVILFVVPFYTFAQNDTNKVNKSNALENVDFHVLVDSYYAIDINSGNDSASKARKFSSNSMYNDEFRLNIALLMIDYKSPKLFSSVAFQFGDIPLLFTPVNKQFTKYLKRAYFGYNFNDNTTIKLGYMPNYIGYESSIPAYNFLSTTSVGGYFEPANILGAELKHNFSKKFSASLYYYNSYHIVSKNNDNKSVGMSLIYEPLKNLTFLYGNSLGDESDFNYQNQWLFYNNIIATYSFGKFDIAGFFDFALQTNSDNDDTNKTAYMNTGMIQIRYNISPKLDLTVRGEWYNDPNSIISEGAGDSGDFLRLYGVAAGFTFKPIKNFYIKCEYDYLASDQSLFSINSKIRNSLVFCSGITF